VRKTFLLALAVSAALCIGASRPSSPREKIAEYFRGWYAQIPGSEVVVQPTREVALRGLETYRVERRSSSKSYQETSIAFYDAGRGEVFVGDVLHDPNRAAAGKPFDVRGDLANVQASLSEAFGLPVVVEPGAPQRGQLTPLAISIRQEKDPDAFVRRAGFISDDGATLMLGEFHPLDEGAAAFRQRLLGQNEGVRTASGRFAVTEFLDFQCDRCRVRTPDVRRTVEGRGGAVEIHFLPIVKMHDWAFAAAESAAALANVRPELYRRYEEAVFARSEGMTSAAARELASDIAEAAGAREAFAAEVASGRARARVVRDVGLAMRLGITATPAFLYRGALLPGEKGLLETYLWESLPAPSRRTPAPTK
jgi:hypothetical protein